MDFKLSEYHQGVTDDELIEDVKRVSALYGDNYLSFTRYKKMGKYSEATFRHHFSSWLNTLSLSGLRNTRNTMEMKRITDQQMIEDCMEIALALNKKTVTTGDYAERGKYALPTIIERFGDWATFLTLVGLSPTGVIKKVPEKEMFEEIERIWTKLGRQPTTTDMKKGISIYSLDTFTRRFGGWRNALLAFLEYINSDIEYEEAEKGCSTKKSKNRKKIMISQDIDYKHSTPRNINDRLRFKVLARDDFKCCACGASPAISAGVQLHVDHIKPWSKGGETVMDNLQTLCAKCNLGKSDIEL